jgi:hypothetical protein
MPVPSLDALLNVHSTQTESWVYSESTEAELVTTILQ